MTDLDVAGLVPLAKSWEYAPELKVDGQGYSTTGYDQAERAYRLKKEDAESASVSFRIHADREHPLVNPAFVIENWGTDSGDLTVTLNGEELAPGASARVGYRNTLDGTDLIVWIDAESTEPVDISIARQ
jgi:hypothetical protein